jgi:nicotinamide phosphoribosyltransferase
MKVLPILLSDSYKQFHFKMYPKDMTLLFSNMTPRKSRMKNVDKAVFFGLQYYLKEYLIKQWNELFFQKEWSEIEKEYKRFHKFFSQVDVSTEHLKKLHNLGYLPLKFMALPEGSQVPMRTPFFVMWNTHDDFAWLVNFLETAISTTIWDLITVATISKQFRKVADKYAMETADNTDFSPWQIHDFSQRGRSSNESTFNQAGHLLSAFGTDTIPAVLFLEEYYNANMENEIIGGSVPASEHSVMTSYGKEDEFGAFKRLMEQFPTGILSIVSDSFDLWQVCRDFLPKLKEDILGREGKIVIRPDSGDPIEIICGTNPEFGYLGEKDYCQNKGVVELLWDVFGGTINEKGYKILHPNIGCIYGDSITIDRMEEILKRLKSKGFASTNIVFGAGSWTFNANTRDSLGMAVKSTYCEVGGDKREIFKDPITDDGMKKSAKGLIAVFKDENGELYIKDQSTWEEVLNCEFIPVFENGLLLRDYSLQEIRERLIKD